MSGAAPGHESTLGRSRADEFARALRALLMRPLMGAAHPDFAVVRQQAGVLRAWLARETGWTLLVDRDCARLEKRPVDLGDATRGAPGFGRRRYVLLCLAAAVLERAEPQITLKTLGERLLALAADPALEAAGFVFRLVQAHERRDLVQVCRFLLETGVLARVAGDEEDWVQRGGDALYDLHRGVLARLLACTRGPSTFAPDSEPRELDARLVSLVEGYVPDSEEGRREARRHALARRLLDDPVTCFDELDEAGRDYLANQRGPLAARLARAVALAPEQRAEGVALVDPDGELSDVALPAEGTEAQVTLLVAQHLVERTCDEPDLPVPESAVVAFVRGAADRYGRYWRKQAREPGAEREFAAGALERLAALKLVRREDGAVRVRAALARYALGEAELRQPSLLDP